ncbi:MAG: hemerythrin family protein [Thiothrix sp.]|nr:hemerythrin family protein [Thiothrix sp.]HPQ97686.1 hemerythrin family protein [Thiolinea sp.]
MRHQQDFTDCTTLPEVALAFMNTVHCEELTLVAGLKVALEQSGVVDADIAARLQAWLEHTEAHFAREERLMQEYDFFAYPVHQGEHAWALAQLRAVQQRWQTQPDRAGLLAYLQEWRAWLQQHIGTMDTVTARFLSRFNPEVTL